jgi:F-type H+-transporting ATPase subunit epsilon
VALDVHVVTPERELWSGDASTVVARGVAGEVGILTGHAPLMVQLAIGPLRILRDGDPEMTVVVDGGFLHVTSEGEGGTRVDVLAEGAELAGEIDADAARRRAADLEAELDKRDDDASTGRIEALKTELAKARARIDLAG